ncbi:hypothetical protein A359_02020 [secondary endosymbiont of Ctenarytaina eucalypti]|uniref:Uncharacterized protein n=1 Tax=secondary endosymbiont of Ctenarytaina eucalypti TaxID=1199245 RepID=J3YRD4_9ENTR|nr:hypothetical protein A359_02020 [secondary endosymbiont of Ctenarytaina eucalypti]
MKRLLFISGHASSIELMLLSGDPLVRFNVKS